MRSSQVESFSLYFCVVRIYIDFYKLANTSVRYQEITGFYPRNICLRTDGRIEATLNDLFRKDELSIPLLQYPGSTISIVHAVY